MTKLSRTKDKREREIEQQRARHTQRKTQKLDEVLEMFLDS